MENFKIVHNREESRFFTIIEGTKAYLLYDITDGKLVVYSTYVPKEFEGRGIAAALTKECYAFAKAQNLIPDATCSYAVMWLKRHNLNQ